MELLNHRGATDVATNTSYTKYIEKLEKNTVQIHFHFHH